MKANEKGIRSIIEGKKRYKIPLFQRAYVWGKKHWETLWDDLIDLSKKNNNKHFFGSLVTVEENVNSGVIEYLLIDGQQRLTTIFILLAALRDKAQKSEDDLAKEIEYDYLFNGFRNKNVKFKLQPTQVQGDRQCFEKIIQGGELNENNKDNKIRQAFDFFNKALLKEDIDLTAIVDGLRIVHIELNDNDDPYKIFESLNATGEDLSQADLVRNYFFMKIKDEDLVNRNYKDYWEPMEQKLGDNLSEYIRHYLLKDNRIVKKNEVYFILKNDCDNLKQSAIVEKLSDLYKFSIYYEKILDPKKEKNRKISELLSRLNQIEITVSYPFLLNIYGDFSSNPQRISENQFVELLEILENFLIRRFICKIPTHGLNHVFPSLYEKSSRCNIANLKLELLNQKYPTDFEFSESFKTVHLYNRGVESRQKTKFLLTRLEYFNNKEPVNVDDRNISIEHIMPQKLTKSWKKSLGSNWEEVHKKLCHTIGNLTLSGTNSEMANSEFKEKQKILRESNFRLNRYFNDLTQWNAESIKQRADSLTEIALEIWSYFGESQTDANLSANDMKGKKPISVTIMGDSYPVSSWRDVMQKTLESVINMDTDSEIFNKILEQFPQNVALEKKFRSYRQLSNGSYIETNVDARNIYRFCRDLVQLAGLSDIDWQVEIIS